MEGLFAVKVLSAVPFASLHTTALHTTEAETPAGAWQTGIHSLLSLHLASVKQLGISCTPHP